MSDADAYNITQLAEQLSQVNANFEEYKKVTNANIDAFFLCTKAVIIFLMQAGFAFLEAGAVRSKNTTNIIFKNVLDSFLSIIGYWAIGWGISWGPIYNDTLGIFMGQGDFFANNLHDFPKFFFQFVFAATAGTIVAGAVAERCEFVAYVVYACTLTSWVYPVLAHWGFNDVGWMKAGFTLDNNNVHYLDFAGAGLVHLCGGITSLASAYIIGPRIGRFPTKAGEQVVEIKGHSVPLASLGGFILIFGFLAFNGGSTGTITVPGSGDVVSLAMTNTIMCAAYASLFYLGLHYFTKGKLSLLYTINACLAGQVAACAGCDASRPWTNIITGGGAALTYLLLSNLSVKLRIDDPLDAFAVHAGGGFWGLFSTAIVRDNGIISNVWMFITGGEHFVWFSIVQLGWQILCAIAIMVWSLMWMAPIFYFLRKIGKLRVPREAELKGIDIFKHGEAAYPLAAYGHGWDDYEPVKRRESVSRPDISLEQLAVAYDVATTTPEERELRKRSIWLNPSHFETPENHHRAHVKTISKGPQHNTVSP